MIQPILAQFEIPAAAYVWIVGLIIAALIVFGGIFASGRKLRRELADELKRELVAQAQPTPMSVQQPLHVKAATEFVTKEEHEKLARAAAGFVKKDEFEKFEAKIAEDQSNAVKSRKGMYISLEQQAQQIATVTGDLKALRATNEAQSETLKELRTDGKNTASKVDTLIGEQRVLNQQIQQLAIAWQAKLKS